MSSYIRITGIRLTFINPVDGTPAMGFKVWQVKAGDTPLVTTYGAPNPDGSMGAANANPIILLDSGKCDVLVTVPTKICFCLPTSTGPTDGLIDYADWLGQQQGSKTENGAAHDFADNTYKVDIVPPYSSIPDMLSLVMMPDATNYDTIAYPTKADAQKFIGTGINDINWFGPYSGNTAGAVFRIEIDSGVVDAPTAACTAALAGTGAGLLSNGIYTYKITYVSGLGETDVGPVSFPVTVVNYAANGKINLTNIPVSPITGVSARNIYRTKTGGSTYYLVDTIPDNTVTIYTDNIADSALVTEPPTPFTPPACVAALAGTGAGLLSNGVYSYLITFVTSSGESAPGTASNTVTVSDYTTNGKISLTNIPIAAQAIITARNIYRTKEDGSVYYFLATISDNVTTTYTDNIADTSLTVLSTGASSISDTVTLSLDGTILSQGTPLTGARQTWIQGISYQASEVSGHTLGDAWTLTVMTPTRLDFCGLGADLIYKSVGTVQQPLDGGDITVGFPAHLDRAAGQSVWELINPSLPVLQSIIPLRVRKEISTDYTIDPDLDQGVELNAIKPLTFKLPNCPNAVSHFFYIRNGSNGLVTIDAGTYIIRVLNTSTAILGPGSVYQLDTNGVDWHILTSLGYPILTAQNKETVGVASSSFTDLIPGIKYRLDYEIITGGSGTTLFLIFNDAGTNYIGAIPYTSDIGVVEGDGYIVNGIPLANENAIGLGVLSWGSIFFSTIMGDDTYVKVNGSSTYWNAPHIYNGNIFGYYDGAAALTKATVITDGTFTGTLSLYQVG